MQRRGIAFSGSATPGGEGADAFRGAPVRKATRAFVRSLSRQRLGPLPLPVAVVALFLGVSLWTYSLEYRSRPQASAFLGRVGDGGSAAPAAVVSVEEEAVLASGNGGTPSQEELLHWQRATAAIGETVRVRGVALVAQQRYLAMREAGGFDCTDGSASFASFADVVNDDFCDCKDGSDEPGTSACSGAIGLPSGPAEAPGFACGWHLEPAALAEHKARARVVRLSAVNDGICDCCGGEDEWDSGTPCRDTCAEAEAEENAHASLALAGSRAREAYASKAVALKHDKKYSGIDGGPDNVFLAAAAAGCLTLDDGDYRYEVCLFDHVTQRGGGRHFKLGQKGTWSTSLWEDGRQRNDYSKLIMGGGEFCAAAHAARKVEILFECSPTPAVISLQETQVCVYSVVMHTPAACQPLAH